MDIEAIRGIPLTAWEQGAILIIFVLMIGAVLGWSGRQQSSWQKFITTLNKQWQDFLTSHSAQDEARMCNQENKIDRLTETVITLVQSVNTLTDEIRVTKNHNGVSKETERTRK